MNSPESSISIPLESVVAVLDPNDALHPFVPERIIDFTYNGDLLDKSKGNWKEWSKTVKAQLGIAGLGVHLMDNPGYNLPPDPLTHLYSRRNWDNNECVTMAFINLRIAEAEYELCEGKLTAKACWEAVHDFHEGPVAQINLALKALVTHIPYDETAVRRAREIRNDIRRAFQMRGGITEETFICIALINGLGSAAAHTHTYSRNGCS